MANHSYADNMSQCYSGNNRNFMLQAESAQIEVREKHIYEIHWKVNIWGFIWFYDPITIFRHFNENIKM
jgi:hypothetical protein